MALDMGPMATQHQLPCQTLVACLAQLVYPAHHMVLETTSRSQGSEPSSATMIPQMTVVADPTQNLHQPPRCCWMAECPVVAAVGAAGVLGHDGDEDNTMVLLCTTEAQRPGTSLLHSFFYIYIRPVLSSSKALGLTVRSLLQCCRAQCSHAMNCVPRGENMDLCLQVNLGHGRGVCTATRKQRKINPLHI